MVTPQKVNINAYGMYLRTNTHCETGQEIFVFLGDPSMKTLIAVKAKVIRVTQISGDWKFGIGVQFLDVPPREAGIIKEIERTARFTLPRVILMIDDDALMELISKKLPNDRYDVVKTRTIEELKKSYKEEKPTLVIANISGTDKEIMILRKAAGDAAVVVITSDTGSELKSMSGLHGIYEIVQKPVDHEVIMKAVRQSIQAYRMTTEREEKELSEITIKKDGITNKKKVRRLVARSGNMVSVHRQVERVAGLSSDPVLLSAESGAGKEVAANWIHLLSDRRDKPFAIADLSAIPVTLMESTLFGHLKGSFTGADKNQPGVVGEAKGGTLFLDEISVLHRDLQPKLLRLLAEGEYKRIGETKMRQANARIIIATNEDLASMVRQGKFREDLYNRLNVHQIRIPPLRERTEEDRHELALEIIVEQNHKYKTNVERLGSEAYDQLMTYSWPGNVRDLENAVKRSLPGTKGNTLMKFDLGSSIDASSPSRLLDFEKPWKPNNRIVVDHFECIYCGEIYDKFNRNVTLASNHAGMTPQQFNRKLRKHKLRSL